jgi:tocopherol O-methyltransferase
MIACQSVTKKSIRRHYDLATPFYWLLWGPHIHHGLWEGDESASQAQLQLLDRLATSAAIKPGDRVLDVGCGVGGSAIALAQRYGCQVSGVTLSSIQRNWARLAAGWQGVAQKVRFECRDAERMTLPPATFDVVWNIECSEHFFDKPAFFRRAADALVPGGRLALCAWLAGEAPGAESQVRAVCEAFLCPSLGTADDHRRWLEAAGLTVHTFNDLTQQVMPTWEICQRRVRRSGVRLLGWLAGRRMRSFLARFAAISDAYRTGGMRYGLFVGTKPARSVAENTIQNDKRPLV